MISLHIVADNATQAILDSSLAYLKATKQPAVNVGGGSQIDRAMQFVERCHIELPTIQVFWRILEDTGNAIKMDNGTWWRERVEPRLKWMQEHKVIFVLDNETSGSDTTIQYYVNKSIDRLYRLHDVGLYGATCRFATGNIQDGSQPGQSSQYPLLKPLLFAMTDGDWISPNEYRNTPGKSSGGHLQRYKLITNVVPEKKFKISIGECGILKDYGAREGYTTIPISGGAAAQAMIDDERFYENGTIPRFWFVRGGYDDWKNTQVGQDALNYLTTYYADHPIAPVALPPVVEPPIVIPPPPPYKPEPIIVGTRYQVTTPLDYVVMHLTPAANGVAIGQLPNKSVITALEESLVGSEYWRKVSFGNLSGWINLQSGAVQFAPYLGDAPSTVTIPIDLLKDIQSSLLNLQAKINADLVMVKAILDKVGTTP